jgi:sigma-B regulation protein RsbU (phosphoserine phosphatase)
MTPAASLTEHPIRVLLVDDQTMVGEMVRRMLVPESDISFHFCQDPTQALKTAAELEPTVILQDLVMPEIDGLTLVRYYRAHPKLADIPLIVLSTKEEAVTKAEAFSLGANDYLVKLPDRIELVARIRYHSRAYINLLERNEAFEALKKSQQELAHDLDRASRYVVSLLPKPVETGPVRASWRYVPTTQLGGDSFGYHWIDPEHFAFYLLDVCGHGVGSALLSVSALNTLRSQALPDIDFRDPAAVLGGMNEAYQSSSHGGLYFTLWYGVYDTRARTLTHASAGHPPSLLMANNEIARVLSGNLMIGAFPRVPFRSAQVDVPAGARLYLFSDGVYEVSLPDDSMWSLEDLCEYLRDTPHDGGAEIDQLYACLQKMHGQDILEDDFSMVRVDFQ